MKNELGSVSLILASLATADVITIDERDRVTVSTDTTEIDTARAKMNERRNACNDPRERDRILCQFQSSHEYMLGAWHYTLGANIYGYAVGDSLRSNLGGGTWARTPRGFTLAQAIEWGCKQAKEKNVRFSFGLTQLPEGLRSAVRMLAG